MAMRFKRVSAAFDDVARARLCDSSGSDHSEEDDSAELSDLVDSFLERDVIELQVGDEDGKMEEERSDFDSENCWSDSLTREMLQSLIGGDDGNDDGDDDVKRKIRDELEVKCRSLENCQAEGFKRRLMTLLRRRGFDAGKDRTSTLDSCFYFPFYSRLVGEKITEKRTKENSFNFNQTFLLSHFLASQTAVI